jgi:polyhydroxyalkanoate synthesis regulator phasin
MPGFGDLVQKAFYLGVGMASYAGERAGSTFSELRGQAQKLADEMVARGEMTTEEARRMVDDMVQRAQQAPSARQSAPNEPRRIEILDDSEIVQSENPESVDELRRQVMNLQQELEQIRQKDR